ncbi:hypothetical protein [Sulfurimonas sp.]
MIKSICLYLGFLLFIKGALFATTINIKIPKVPEVPKVEAVVPTLNVTTSQSSQSNEAIIKEAISKQKVTFSNHVAPVLIEVHKDDNKNISVGEIKNARVTAYLHAPLMSVTDVSSALTGVGFRIVKTYKIDKKGLATAVLFTNTKLIQAASKANRGFAAVLRVTIDKKDKLVSITNPIYILKAFLQDNYNEKVAKESLNSLQNAFKELKNSQEIVKFSALEHFQFMAGMPKYEDMQTIKKAANTTLLKKARKSKKLVFEQKLENGSYLIGVKLSKRTTRFIKKTGYQNAALLPYPVLIENGEAKILDPKYYISVMYPLLKMSQFMTIATVPGAINKDIDKIFR